MARPPHGRARALWGVGESQPVLSAARVPSGSCPGPVGAFCPVQGLAEWALGRGHEHHAEVPSESGRSGPQLSHR